MATTLPRLQGRVKRLTTLLRFVLRQWSRTELHTGMPGIVETYDATTRRARVLPGLNALMADRSFIARPPIVNVPVLWPSFGGITIEASELVPGTAYWLSFSERGLGMFKESLKVSDFPRERFFDMGDAVLHAGSRFLPDTVIGPGAGNFAIGDGTIGITIGTDSIVIAQDTRSVSVTATGIEIMGDVTVTGDLAVTGELSQGGTDVGAGHRHVYPDPGPPPNQGRTGPVFP